MPITAKFAPFHRNTHNLSPNTVSYPKELLGSSLITRFVNIQVKQLQNPLVLLEELREVKGRDLLPFDRLTCRIAAQVAVVDDNGRRLRFNLAKEGCSFATNARPFLSIQTKAIERKSSQIRLLLPSQRQQDRRKTTTTTTTDSTEPRTSPTEPLVFVEIRSYTGLHLAYIERIRPLFGQKRPFGRRERRKSAKNTRTTTRPASPLLRGKRRNQEVFLVWRNLIFFIILCIQKVQSVRLIENKLVAAENDITNRHQPQTAPSPDANFRNKRKIIQPYDFAGTLPVDW